MGLTLENFDGAGIFRGIENGANLDITGELDGIFYDDVDGLATAMRNHPKLSACLVNRLYAYGTGGPVSLRYDRDSLKWLENRFVDKNHQLPQLLRELALSQAFSSVRPAESPENSTIAADDTFGLPIHTAESGLSLAKAGNF